MWILDDANRTSTWPEFTRRGGLMGDGPALLPSHCSRNPHDIKDKWLLGCNIKIIKRKGSQKEETQSKKDEIAHFARLLASSLYYSQQSAMRSPEE